jgi:hypothetical protein
MSLCNFFLFSVLASSVTARLPLHSSYADKCIYTPATGHRYHDKTGPIGPNHKAFFLCGAYPTEADFTPLPGVETADKCSLSCTEDCEGSTWSEVAGTEVQCHSFRNFQGQTDETEALIMMIGSPSKAEAADQYTWLCDGQDSATEPISRFIPPNIEAQYYCDKSPGAVEELSLINPSVMSPESCLLICTENSGCEAAVWSVDPVGCMTTRDSGVALEARNGTVFMKYVEHQLPGTRNGQESEVGPPNPIAPENPAPSSPAGGPPNPIGHRHRGEQELNRQSCTSVLQTIM